MPLKTIYRQVRCISCLIARAYSCLCCVDAARDKANARPDWTSRSILDPHVTAVNSIAWAPYEYGLQLSAASSDGRISILTHKGELTAVRGGRRAVMLNGPAATSRASHHLLLSP